MEKIKLSIEDLSSRELVREVLFRFIRDGKVNQMPSSLDYFNNYVEFKGNKHLLNDNFILLFQELFWELIIQGVLTPGLNVSNPNLPFFRITEYGKKVLSDEGYIPHDPSGYINRYKSELKNPDEIVLCYMVESLRNFATGCFLSANLMIGIASERVFLKLCNALLLSLKDKAEMENFRKIMLRNSMIAKFEFVQNKLEIILQPNKRDFLITVRTTLFGISSFLRIQRNDLGHPQDDLQIPDREQVYVNLRLFPQYCKIVEQVEFILRESSEKGTIP